MTRSRWLTLGVVVAVGTAVWLAVVTNGQEVPAHFDEITADSEGP